MGILNGMHCLIAVAFKANKQKEVSYQTMEIKTINISATSIAFPRVAWTPLARTAEWGEGGGSVFNDLCVLAL